MAISEELRGAAQSQLQGAMALQLAFIGVANGLFTALAAAGRPVSAPELATTAQLDAGYVARWCDAAYAFGYLDEQGEGFVLTELGEAYRPDQPGSLMPLAVQAVLGAHMSERAAGLMPSGERPGERVLAERETILPWFGPMLEASFAPLFLREVLPNIPEFAGADERGGLVVDLGCGNGWYLRALAGRYTRLRGIGLDGFEENIRQAQQLAERQGLAERLGFQSGDIHHFSVEEPAALIVMNRAMHHVWDEKDNVFRILREHLAPGGAAVIWEPNWPAERSDLRAPAKRGMAFQNLAEHVQGNHFLRPEEIAEELERAGMVPRIHLLASRNEAVVVGTKPA